MTITVPVSIDLVFLPVPLGMTDWEGSWVWSQVPIQKIVLVWPFLGVRVQDDVPEKLTEPGTLVSSGSTLTRGRGEVVFTISLPSFSQLTSSPEGKAITKEGVLLRLLRGVRVLDTIRSGLISKGFTGIVIVGWVSWRRDFERPYHFSVDLRTILASTVGTVFLKSKSKLFNSGSRMRFYLARRCHRGFFSGEKQYACASGR